jgi:diguanylate cyclase (GGDEF)-like protein
MNWFYTGSVLIILLFGCYIFFTNEQQKNIELFKIQSNQNGSLLAELVQMELLNNNYTSVMNIIDRWYEQYPSIYEIELLSANGFVLCNLKRDSAAGDVTHFKQIIQYGYRGNVSINITNSLDPIFNRSNKDIYYLLLISIILTLASGEFLWLIEQKRYNRILENLSYRDQLTEIFNRRYFDETLYQEWHRASRTQQTLSLIMIDVDQFKPYNDNFGHQAGDACLAEIARALHKTLKRPGEFVARYGGEEFAVVLPNIDHLHAKKIAEMLRQAVLDLSIPTTKNSNNSIISISLGIASHDARHIETPEELIMVADQALYRAKHAGRNCVKSSPAHSI